MPWRCRSSRNFGGSIASTALAGLEAVLRCSRRRPAGAGPTKVNARRWPRVAPKCSSTGPRLSRPLPAPASCPAQGFRARCARRIAACSPSPYRGGGRQVREQLLHQVGRRLGHTAQRGCRLVAQALGQQQQRRGPQEIRAPLVVRAHAEPYAEAQLDDQAAAPAARAAGRASRRPGARAAADRHGHQLLTRSMTRNARYHAVKTLASGRPSVAASWSAAFAWTSAVAKSASAAWACIRTR